MALQVARRKSFGAPSPVYGICLVDDGSDPARLASRGLADEPTAFATAQVEGERRFRVRFWKRGTELPFHSGAALAAVAELSERGWMDRFGGTLETAVGSIEARHDRGRVAWLQLTMLQRGARPVPDPAVLAEVLRCGVADAPPAQRWRLGSQEVAVVTARSLEELESARPGERARVLARDLGLERWVVCCDRARDRLADVTMLSIDARYQPPHRPSRTPTQAPQSAVWRDERQSTSTGSTGSEELEVDGWGAAALAWAWHLEGKGRPQLTVAQPRLGARVLAVVADTHVSIGGVTS